MDSAFIILAGIAVAFNFIFLKFKLDRGRYQDLITDASILIALSFLFSGTASGLAIGMVGSFIISIYLYFSPPKYNLLNKKPKHNFRVRDNVDPEPTRQVSWRDIYNRKALL